MGLNSPVYRGVAVEDRPQQPGRAGQTKKEREKKVEKPDWSKLRMLMRPMISTRFMIGQGKKYGHGTWPFISAHKIGITIFIRMATYQPLYKGGLFTESFFFHFGLILQTRLKKLQFES